MLLLLVLLSQPLLLALVLMGGDPLCPAVLLQLLLLAIVLVGRDTLCPAVVVLLLPLSAPGMCRMLMRESWKAVLGQRLALPKRCVRRSTAVLPNLEDR